MKRNYILLLVTLVSMFAVSCEKNGVQVIDTPLTSGAQIKFFNFGVNSPSINFYANDVKLSATASATGIESAIGLVYGSVFPSSTYSFLNGGSYTFKGQISGTALADANLPVASLTATVENGKHYSLYTSGFYDVVAKKTDAFIVEDKLPAMDNTVAYVRFVNGISNGTSALDLVIKNTTSGTEAKVASGVAYKSASEFVKVPIGVYEVFARYTGATTNTITRNGTSVVGFLGGKVYTISSRGDITVSAATAVNRGFLDNTANQ